MQEERADQKTRDSSVKKLIRRTRGADKIQLEVKLKALRERTMRRLHEQKKCKLARHVLRSSKGYLEQVNQEYLKKMKEQ